jgi:flavin reductase (DIM6/NTAB) family NADH-FMN oxidoreductase RutF
MSEEAIKTLDTAQTQWTEVYKRLVEAVVPRPIALVSTVDASGRPNLAPFSFFNVVSSNPPFLAFCPTRSGRTGEMKDTLKNIMATGEFVVAVVTEEMAEAVNAASAPLPHGESEFDHSGLTPVPSTRIAPARVAESPVNMECELVEIHSYGREGGAGNLVVGRILAVHLAKSVIDGEGRILPELLKAVGRMGGEDWVRTRDTFTLSRPR